MQSKVHVVVFERSKFVKKLRFSGGTKQSIEILEERLSESSGSSSGVLSSGKILQVESRVLEDRQSVLPLFWSRVLANWSRVE